MMEIISLQRPTNNKLLTALPKKQYQRLLPCLEEIDLFFGDVLFNPGDKIRYVYFPVNGVLSLLAVENEVTVEIGLVGNEGMVGLPVFLGVPTSRISLVVQGSGAALRMKSADFLRECKQNDLLSHLMRRYTHYLLMQVSQTVLCNRLHLIEQRLAHILLTMHDRMMTNQFTLKQEFLAQILGARREAVSIAAGNLQKQQLISYSRGNLSIIDRNGLEATCCQCYNKVADEYQKLLAAQLRLN
jgi:CRP-like cAMP-binding protein